MNETSTKGQTIIEYSLVLGIIVTVVLAMQPMIKRAGQAMIKMVADEIGNQQEADQRAFYENSLAEGHLDYANSISQSIIDTQTVEFMGATSYTHDDLITTSTDQSSNLGFSLDPIP
jgi:hypothetical protein